MDNKETYFNSKEFRKILQRYEQSIKMEQQEYFESEELTDIAEFYYKEGRVGEAISVLDYAIRLHPGAAMPLVFRGRMALIDENDVESARHYVDMIVDQLDLDCLYLQAEIMIAEKDVDGADRFLRSNLERIDEDDVPDYILDIAMLFIDYGQPDKAAEWLERSDETDLMDYREVKARIAFAHGDYEQSEKIFEKLLDEDPYSGRYWNSLASTQFMSNRINDSITSSEYSIAINPNDQEALLNKANGLFSLGNYAEALKYYSRFYKLAPEEGAAPLIMGNCLLNMGKASEALPHYEEALNLLRKRQTSTSEVLQCLAFTYSQLGRQDEALASIDEALQLSDVNKGEVLVVKGHILLENSRVKEAINCFVEALRTTSFSQDVFFRIAISVFDCGYPTIAYRMFKTYIETNDDTGGEGLAYLASCCLHLNKRDEYLEYLKLACDNNPLEARKILGDEFPQGMEPKDYYSYAISRQSI